MRILRAFIDVLLFEVVSPGAMSFLEIFSGKNFVYLSCFELSIHLSVIFFPRTIFSRSSRLVRYTDKCMESSKHDWTLSAQLHPSNFSLEILFLVPKVSNS